MQITDDNEITNVYDPKDAEFTRIRETSSDSNSGCMCGLDFLLWLPTENQFATFYMYSKSARRVAPNLRLKMNEETNTPGPATLGVKLVSNKKYSWHVSVIQDCTTPFDFPDAETFIKAITKFQNPPKNEVETVEEDNRDR